jgi:hypothetical protein
MVLTDVMLGILYKVNPCKDMAHNFSCMVDNDYFTLEMKSHVAW